jgi:hypothetical protein
MTEGASSNAAKTTSVAGAGGAKEQHEATAETREQLVERVAASIAFLATGGTTPEADERKAARRAAHRALLKARLVDYLGFHGMKEEDVVEEYRQAGRLHTYDPDKERQKRLARFAIVYPGSRQWSKATIQNIRQYIKYLDEDEDDYKIGISSLIVEE